MTQLSGGRAADTGRVRGSVASGPGAGAQRGAAGAAHLRPGRLGGGADFMFLVLGFRVSGSGVLGFCKPAY